MLVHVACMHGGGGSNGELRTFGVSPLGVPNCQVRLYRKLIANICLVLFVEEQKDQGTTSYMGFLFHYLLCSCSRPLMRTTYC